MKEHLFHNFLLPSWGFSELTVFFGLWKIHPTPVFLFLFSWILWFYGKDFPFHEDNITVKKASPIHYILVLMKSLITQFPNERERKGRERICFFLSISSAKGSTSNIPIFPPHTHNLDSLHWFKKQQLASISSISPVPP